MNDKNKIKIIAICSKSGVGKSTVIDYMMKDSNKFHYVVSKSSRKPRNDEDLKTHIFVSEQDFYEDKNKGVILAEYEDKNNSYHNWVTLSCLDENKYNLFAVDINSALKLAIDERFDTTIVYLHCEEEQRLARLKKRQSDINKYLNEEHLSLSVNIIANYQKFIKIIDTTDKNPYEIKEEIYRDTNLYYENFLFLEAKKSIFKGYYFEMLGRPSVLLHKSNVEDNIVKLLDEILDNYDIVGTVSTPYKIETYVEYNNKNFVYRYSPKTKIDYNFYKQMITTFLKWKCGVYYD